MGPEERRGAIMEFVRVSQEVKVDEIADRLAVSRETIRRDLALLDQQGLLRRVHGGAQPSKTAQEAPFLERIAENTGAKERIARAAAALFDAGDTIFIDTGSTTEFFARALGRTKAYTVITNSLGVARKMHEGGGGSQIYLVGGQFRGDSGQVLGPIALEQIAKFRADHAVLTCGAIDMTGGVMDFDVEEAMMARAMIAQSLRVTVIADSSKFGQMAMVKVCGFDRVDSLVTDRQPPDDIFSALAAHGVETIIADEGVPAFDPA